MSQSIYLTKYNNSICLRTLYWDGYDRPEYTTILKDLSMGEIKFLSKIFSNDFEKLDKEYYIDNNKCKMIKIALVEKQNYNYNYIITLINCKKEILKFNRFEYFIHQCDDLLSTESDKALWKLKNL